MSWVPGLMRASARQGVCPAHSKAFVINRTAIRRQAEALTAAFPPNTLHAFAAKANPLQAVLETMRDLGLGCEVASMGEFTMARRVFAADDIEGARRIVYDSPVKSLEELKAAVYTPCFLNVDNFQELDVIAEMHKDRPILATVGIRVNPQVGAGGIGITSTGLATSKFGVGIDEVQSEIIEAFSQHEFLKMLHVHTGSQGLGLELMVAGVKKVADFALTELKGRVEVLDIGGGLPVNFSSDEITPSYQDYATALKAAIPALFDTDCPLRLVTEFGRTLSAKAGVLLSRVEYTKSNGGRYILQSHVGADLCVRTVWAPQDWPLRVDVYTGDGEVRDAELVNTDVAGPCCMGGDLVAVDRPLPKAERGDVVCIKDVGGYFHSSYSYYNLRQAPAVFMYDEAEGDEAAEGRMVQVRREATVEETCAFMMTQQC